MADNYEYKPRTAQDEAGTLSGVNAADEENARMAEEAGVVGAEYVDYELAMSNYESRTDVEPLNERRAREAGRSFDEANFRRVPGGSDSASGVTTSDEVRGVDADKQVAGGEVEAAREQAKRAEQRKSGK